MAHTINKGDISMVCPYCGDEYGAQLGCCGESRAHGVFVVEGIDDQQFDTEKEALEAADKLMAEEKLDG